ncbi:MAG: FAD-binding protein [Phycisphaerales bacterium]|nr:FAD-binding protein [Phycisphaerales bacterium]
MTSLPQVPPTLDTGFARALTAAVRGEVRLGYHDRMLYATDASLYQVEPLGVVIPADVADAVAAARFCLGARVPLLPRGGGTSLAGQCTNRAVVIDLSPNCRGVVEVDAPGQRARVEPGITVDDLNDLLQGQGLFWAPDPATSRHANVGGCIGNNAAGARSVRFGRTSENLLGVDVLLASGEQVRLERGAAMHDQRVAVLTERVADVVVRHERLIRERFPRTIRRNAGYALDMVLAALDRGGIGEVNLAHLLCGSEGTLALTLGAELALRPLPNARGLAVLAFESVDAAIAEVPALLESRPSAVELLDDMVIGLARANAEYRRYVDLLPGGPGNRAAAVLYVEYFAEAGPAEIEAKFAALRGRYSAAAAFHTDAGAMLSAWKLRKAGEPLLHGIPGARKPVTFVEDNAIPVERLGEFVRRLREIVTRHGTTAAYWAHASVGVLHVRPLIDLKSEDDLTRMRSIAVETCDLARELGGVMSGEHGDGRVRGPLLERFFGPELMGAFREIKAIFDPRNLLNPGNIVEHRPVESITRTLRVNPEGTPVRVPPVETYFAFDDQHGLAGAAEMCNGAGVCRKKRTGTMCPSYMATLDERHSTRGRGNALRLAITGQAAPGRPGEATWDDPETMATLNLCLSCKACKSECPSNVDIARLKAEYTAQRFRARGGAPLGALLMGHVRTLNRLGCAAPGLSNALARSAPGKWLSRRLLNIDPRRDLPPFARPMQRDFTRRDRDLARAGDERPIVAIFGDCFSTFNEPAIGRAARRVLDACGYRVMLPRHGCCGRALISMGALAEARPVIERTARALRPWVRDPRVKAIVFLEPSCLSAITDDWLDLNVDVPADDRRALAAKCALVEDFVDRAWEAHPARPRFRAPEGDVLLHGHCHQKALWGAQTSAALLRRIAGDRCRTLDTGCCGMAGSFGYTTDRYDLSMKIGELALFPQVRRAHEAGPATLCAPGTSCRHQVRDGTGVHALHPIEFAAACLHGPG